MDNGLEIEVKLACSDLDHIERAGLTLYLEKPRYFEDNWLLDSPSDDLLNKGAALRVRSVHGKGYVTYKGAARADASSPLKIREEIETEVKEPDRLVTIFERAGFHRSFRYQKYRTVYRVEIDGRRVEVTFDETPIGSFIEIEGDEKRVLQVIEAAGFSAEDVVRESYPELQAKLCKARGVPLEDLVFQEPEDLRPRL